jgi:hypothetical protein
MAMKRGADKRAGGLALVQFLPRVSATRPVPVLGVSLLLALASVFYAIGHLEIKTSRNDLLSEKEPQVQRFEEISDDFGRLTNAIVVVEGLDLERMKAFITDLAACLHREPEYFENLFYRIDVSSLEGKKLLYLSEHELLDLREKLADYDELIEELVFTPELGRIFAFVNQKISEATVSHLVSSLLGGDDPADEARNTQSTGGAAEESDPVDLSFLRSLLTEMRLALQPGYRFQSPWDTFFDTSAKFSEEGFLTSEDDRFAFMILNPRSREETFTKKLSSLKRLRHHVQALLQEYPDLKAGVTGGTALATDEMGQALRDTAWATVVALVGVGLLFMLVFRQLYNPLLVLASLVLAICWTFGLLTVTVGHLTILSVAFTPILLGLGIDFGIHLLARYNEERARGNPFSSALELSCRHTGHAITAGALTTSLAFFAIMLADFRGIQELGFIAGSGVLLSLVSTFTVLPALLCLVEGKRTRTGQSTLRLGRGLAFLETCLRRPRAVVAGALLITGLGLLAVGKVEFDYNLLNLQAEGTESVQWENRITADSKRSSWFAVTTADSLDEVREKERIFKALPAVKKVDSMADLVPESQQARIQAVLQLEPLVQAYDVEFEEPEPLEPDDIAYLLDKIRFKLRADAHWDPQKKPAEREIVLTRSALVDLVDVLQATPPDEARRLIEPFQEKLFRDFSRKLRLLRANSHPPGPIEKEDVPQELRQRFQGKSGRYLLRIFSRENIWEKEHMTAFVRQLQAVEPEVTGPCVVGFIAIHLMKNGYLQACFYALAAICCVILVTFRKLKESCLALIPLVFTVVWTLGWMGWTGVAFNLANLIALPLVLGIVVDDGIHVVHRFREDPDLLSALVSGSTAQAITLTSWTTMIGFGSLLLCRHQGIFSLGLLLTLGVGIAWVLSLILLPVILGYRRPQRQRRN